MNYIDLYINAKVNSPNTKISYTHDLNSMADFINKPIEEINEFDILEWKKSLEDFSSATIARRIGSVKRFFNFLYENDYIKTNPAKNIKPPKITNKEEDTLTMEQMNDIIACGKNARDKAILAVLASTGLRISELCNIKFADLDENNNIKVLGKGNKWRYVHLNTKVKHYVNDYLKVRKDGCDYLFVSNNHTKMSPRSLHHTIKVMANRANVSGVHAHSMRHYFATALLDNEVPINQISMVMGHADISTTLRYAKIRDKKAVTEQIMNTELF